MLFGFLQVPYNPLRRRQNRLLVTSRPDCSTCYRRLRHGHRPKESFIRFSSITAERATDEIPAKRLAREVACA